ALLVVGGRELFCVLLVEAAGLLVALGLVTLGLCVEFGVLCALGKFGVLRTLCVSHRQIPLSKFDVAVGSFSTRQRRSVNKRTVGQGPCRGRPGAARRRALRQPTCRDQLPIDTRATSLRVHGRLPGWLAARSFALMRPLCR